jgi:hypothetical protein
MLGAGSPLSLALSGYELAMTERAIVSLTLFVRKQDHAINLRARAEVQAVVNQLAGDTTIETRAVDDMPEETVPGPPPLLRVEVGHGPPRWLTVAVKNERRSLKRRLRDLGLTLRD